MNWCFKIDLKPFNFPLIVYIGDEDGKGIQQYLIDNLGEALSDAEADFVWPPVSAARMVWLKHKYILMVRKWEKTNWDISVIAHEVHHLLNFILLDINEERKDNEWEAYFIQDVLSTILNQLDICLQKSTQVESKKI